MGKVSIFGAILLTDYETTVYKVDAACRFTNTRGACCPAYKPRQIIIVATIFFDYHPGLFRNQHLEVKTHYIPERSRQQCVSISHAVFFRFPVTGP